jgi:hypothetical protein
MAQEICKEEPALREIEPNHLAACHFAEAAGENPPGNA